MARVMIEPADYITVRRAVDRAFDLFPVQVKGKKVMIKPNVLRASEASEGVVTNPAVLQAVVEKVESMGPASLIVGDNPGMFNYGDNEMSFEKTGLFAASKGYYQNIGNDSVQVDFNPDFMSKLGVSRAIMECDTFISLPKFKTHGLTVVTGAIKNSYGILPGAQKAKLHKAASAPARFHEMMVDVFRIRAPDFFIVDAVVGMEGNGPASPDLRDIGLLLASDNAVALDSVMATMMGVDPSLLLFLQKAQGLGLGDYDLSKTEIIGELKVLPDFKLPPLGGEAIAGNAAVRQFIESRSMLTPTVAPDLCTGCGTCIDQCPMSALSMGEEYPQVDKEACITCFCCQESCPEKAITLK